MKKAVNRYLNLAGAPYTPNKPNAAITLTNYFTAAATSLAIFGAAYINPSVEKNHLAYLGEGLLGSAISLYVVTNRRKKEAKEISSHSDLLVIDTAPDKATPPTSTDVLSRVTHLKDQYKGRSGLRIDSLKGAAVDVLFGVGYAQYLLQKENPHYYAIAMPFFTIHAMDVFMRYRQLNKVANLEWVITDQGDAVRNFQREEVGKLANANGIVMAPSGLK